MPILKLEDASETQHLFDLPESQEITKAFIAEALSERGLTKKDLKKVNIPPGVTIGEEAFSHCKKLTQLVIPPSVTIGESAFCNCKGLTQLVIPPGVTIGEAAFFNCTGLTQLVIPPDVTIGESAFCSCKGLTQLVIPPGVTIGEGAFFNCTGLTQAIILPSVTIGESAFTNCKGLTQLVIPPGVNIGDWAFSACTGLTQAVIPPGVTIGEAAFCNCTGLTQLVIPPDVTIGESAFRDCTGLTQLVIPPDVTIGESAFRDCTGLTQAVIPPGVTIGNRAFAYCKKLNLLVILPGVTISKSAFHDCQLQQVIAPKGLDIPNFPDSTRYDHHALNDFQSLCKFVETLYGTVVKEGNITNPEARKQLKQNLISAFFNPKKDLAPIVNLFGQICAIKIKEFKSDAEKRLAFLCWMTKVRPFLSDFITRKYSAAISGTEPPSEAEEKKAQTALSHVFPHRLSETLLVAMTRLRLQPFQRSLFRSLRPRAPHRPPLFSAPSKVAAKPEQQEGGGGGKGPGS